MNPLVHYLQAGWKEGRDPSPRFSIKTYLRDHPDIAAAGKEPLAHYLAWRRINPAAPAPEGKADVQAASTRQLPDHGAAAKAAPKSGLSSPCEEAMPLPIPETGLRLIAFYLPQFHPIPENDRWWGEGFTEWRNVTRGQPLFPGHYQPRLPGALGFYDLRLKEVMRRQIELAQQFGIQGFCFHHYWFGGTRLLERPVEQFLADPELDMPFCLCWANENWTRRWDGEERDVLIEQRHSTDDDLAFIADAVRCFRDPRYIRIGNRPVMVVYRPQILPDPAATARVWRNHCRAQGLDLYLVAAQTFGHSDPRPLGFDAAVQFPPHNFAPEEILKPGLVPNFKGKLYDYEAWGRGFLQPQRPGADYPLFRCVSPDWDNTARRGLRATVFADATPDKYARWLEGACLDALRSHPPERRLVFVNAWNEWAEGACLEPDLRHGYAYLNRTAAVLGRLGQGAGSALPRICLLGHDAARAGAQMVLLHLVRWLKENTNLDLRVVLLGDGPLSPQFAEVAPVLFKGNATDSEAFAAEVLNFCDQRIDLLYGNTAVAARVYDSLAALGVPILTHVHELEASLQRFAGAETIAKLLKHTTHFIAPSPPTAENLHRQHGVSTDKLQVIPEFIAPTGTELPAPEIRAELRRNLGLPETQFVVFGCGTQDWRKGADLFVETARLVRDAGRLDVMCCWIGDGLDDRITHPQELIQRYGLEQQVRFLGLHDNPRELFRVGSLFLLPSREDPFPLVCLEAAECGLPIICFAGAGGMPEFVGPDVGEVVPFEDVNAMAAAVLRLASNPAERDRLGRAARVKLLATHVSATEAPKIMSALRSALAAGRHRQSRSQSSLSVSVVVPNYNYARYLEERLASIKAQTYPLHEIIVLDDASQDESAEVIKRWLHTCATPMMFVGNPENSGSVCAQWRKGLELASGDLVWIAEADDYCEPAFLARLAAAFRDPEVVLAYSQSVPVDAAGKLMPNGFGWSPVADAARAASPGLVYTDTVDCRRWEADYVASGDEEIVLALAQQNTIPNASAVLLRRTAALKAIPAALEFKNCGDWAFYLELARQGRFAYFRADLNYFRRHGGSTTLNQSARVIAEGLAIKRRLADEGRLTANSLLESLCRSFMEYEWESRQAPDRVPMREHPACAAELAQLELSLQRILPSGQHPAFLIILPDAETGGGQTAAIRFANGLARDHRVFLINARPDLDDGHLKQMLDPAVLLLEGRLDSKIHRRFSAETPPRWATDAQPLRVAALASLMRFLRIEVVMSHVWWSDKLAFALTDQATTPWFIHMHGCYEFLLGSQDSDPGFRALAPQILRRADGVFYSHPKNLRVFQELNLPPAPVHRVNTGLADPAPPPAGSAPPFVRRDGDFVFCLCARAIPEKGWEEAMRATQAINQRPAAARGNRRARLVLLGDGPHLQDLLARYPDREQIIPLGLHARPTDVLPFCDAGLLPTRFVSESLPNSVIEYLACGLPVIATQHACIPEMIADHGLTAGLTIPLGTADAVTSALAEAMTQLMTNPDLCARFRTSARELFQRKFEIQACIQTMKAKILSSPPGARR
jgi:glycosyltransferase involved in cell wall biosynthesis